MEKTHILLYSPLLIILNRHGPMKASDLFMYILCMYFRVSVPHATCMSSDQGDWPRPHGVLSLTEARINIFLKKYQAPPVFPLAHVIRITVSKTL